MRNLPVIVIIIYIVHVLTYSLFYPLLLADAVSSKPVSAENNGPEWSLTPRQGDPGHSCHSLSADHRQKSDNMVLSVHDGSTPSTCGTLSGQKEIINNTPLAREDHHLHVSSNAAALVTEPRLLTPPLDIVDIVEKVVSEQSKQLSENDLFAQDDFGGTIVENLGEV